jgi:hypothetical protein
MMNVQVDRWVQRTNEWLKVVLMLRQGELFFFIWGGYRDKKKSLLFTEESINLENPLIVHHYY